MPITEKQRIARKRHLGSSDAPAICGVNPPGWSNAGSVYLEKTAEVEADEPTAAQERGNYLERAILDWFEESSGKKIVRNQRRVLDAESRSAYCFMAANLDALTLTEERAVVEAKHSTEGEDWKNGPPDRVLVQAQHQMVVTGLKLTYVPALVIEFKPVFKLFEVPFDPNLANAVMEAELNFWTNHVLKRVPPPETPPLEVVKRLKRVPNKSVVVSDELIRDWLKEKEALKYMKKNAEEAEARLLAALGDAEEGRSNLGTFTYFEQSRKGYTVEPTTFRVPRFKERKPA